MYFYMKIYLRLLFNLIFNISYTQWSSLKNRYKLILKNYEIKLETPELEEKVLKGERLKLSVKPP